MDMSVTCGVRMRLAKKTDPKSTVPVRLLLVLLRRQLPLLPQSVRPLSEHLVGAGRRGPARRVVAGDLQGANLVGPDVEYPAVDGVLRLLPADALAEEVVCTDIGPSG